MLAGNSIPRVVHGGAGLGSAPFFLSSDIFLYNTLDVLSQLGSDGPEDASPTHMDIVLCSYRKWGADCVQRLEGEFSFAIFDPALDRLFCARDQFARRPLVYWSNSNCFAIATDAEDLFQFSMIPRRLNRRKLAAHEVARGECARNEETYHAGILVLPYGSMMTVDKAGVRVSRYWSPGPREGVVPKKPEDAFAALRHLIFESVEQCMNRPGGIAILLSGGLDSSCVASVASKILERQGQGRRLSALTVVTPDKDLHRCPDEREYVEIFRSFPNIDLDYCPVDTAGPFDWLDEPERFRGFFHPQSVYHAPFEKLATLRDSGASVVLSGVGGEAGPTTSGFSEMGRLFVGGHWQSAWLGARQRARVTGAHPLRLLLASVKAYWTIDEPIVPTLMFTRGFAAECDVAGQLMGHWMTHAEVEQFLLNYSLSHRGMRSVHWLTPMQEAMPLLSRSILDFCLSAPGGLRFREGHTRYLVRGAMEGVVPESLRMRRRKMPFINNYEDRYDAQLPRAIAFLDSIAPNDPVRSIVDLPGLRKFLRPTASLALPYRRRLHYAANSIRLILFLRQFSEFRP